MLFEAHAAVVPMTMLFEAQAAAVPMTCAGIESHPPGQGLRLAAVELVREHLAAGAQFPQGQNAA